MHVETRGEGGPRILIVHGWMHSSLVYLPIAEALADAHRVTLIDLPGFGESPPLPQPSLDSLTAWLQDYLRDQHFDLIAGHSLGGSLLLRCLADGIFSQDQRLLLCAPAYLGIPRLAFPAIPPGARRRLYRVRSSMPRSYADEVVRLAAWFTINNKDLVNDAILQSSHRADAETASLLFYELCHDRWRLPPHGTTCKGVILCSESDRIIPNRHLRALRRDSGFQLKLVYGIGHTIAVERPERLLREIDAILQL